MIKLMVSDQILQTLGILYMHAIMSTRLHCIQDLI